MSDLELSRCGFAGDDDFSSETGPEATDRRWMRVALTLARRGLGRTAPNPAVGAVLVKNGVVVGRGWTQPGGRPHAETEALARAGEAARGASLYVTLEPCSHHGKTPPCADAIVAAGVARVVAAIGDPDNRVAGRGFGRLRDAGIEVVTGVCAREAARITAGHITRVVKGRPHVTLKLAVSADGKAGLAGRRPVAITGEESRRRVHMMRAEADAILVGVGTVLADDPMLDCRLSGMAERSPIRVVLDAALRTPPESRLVAAGRKSPTWAIAAVDAPEDRERRLRDAGVEAMRVANAPGGVALSEALVLLATQDVTRLMVEGGPTLASSLLGADLVDEIVLLTGPATLGENAIPALEGKPLAAVTGSARFAEISRSGVGDDVWTRYERV